MFLTLILSALLIGTPIGSSPSVDYGNYSPSTTVNLPAAAFDGDLSTFYASYERSQTWVGLDLGTPHVIDRVGWSPRNDGNGPKRMVLGTFEGANSPDFLDAVPLYMIDTLGTIGQMSYADVPVTRGYRYVRYVGPHDARCNVAELAFYGTVGAGAAKPTYYRPGNLPVVSMHTASGTEPQDKVNELRSCVSIIGTDNRVTADSAGIRLRGNASMDFEKKPYRIKFDSKQKPLDAVAKAKKWTLINNYGDKSLIRNLLAFELSRRLGMEYTPYGRLVDVWLNGEYKGVYQLCDQIEVATGRVEVEKAGGYLIEVDAYADQEPDGGWFRSNKGNPVTIKYPDVDDITQQQYDTIRTVFNTMERNPQYKMDMRSFLRHFLVGEIAGNMDTYWSTYMYKHVDNDTLYVGPTWDHDLSFDNDQRIYPVSNRTGNSNWVYVDGSAAGIMKSIVGSLVGNTVVQTQMKQIYQDARDAGMSAMQMNALVDNLAAEIEESQRLNFTRWSILSTYVHQNPRVPQTYGDEVNFLKNYITRRFAAIDSKLNYVPAPQPVGLTETEAVTTAVKVWRDGQLLILRGGHTYTPQGKIIQ